MRYRLRNDGDETIALTFTSAVEPRAPHRGRRPRHDRARHPEGAGGQAGRREDRERGSQAPETRHFDITFAIDPPARVSVRPIYAVANSEDGFERVYQQTEISCSWDVSIEPDAHVDVEVRCTALGQMVEPEAQRQPARRRKATVHPAGTAETQGRQRR